MENSVKWNPKNPDFKIAKDIYSKLDYRCHALWGEVAVILLSPSRFHMHRHFP